MAVCARVRFRTVLLGRHPRLPADGSQGLESLATWRPRVCAECVPKPSLAEQSRTASAVADSFALLAVCVPFRCFSVGCRSAWNCCLDPGSPRSSCRLAPGDHGAAAVADFGPHRRRLSTCAPIAVELQNRSSCASGIPDFFALDSIAAPLEDGDIDGVVVKRWSSEDGPDCDTQVRSCVLPSCLLASMPGSGQYQ